METWVQIVAVAIVLTAAAWYLRQHPRTTTERSAPTIAVPAPLTGDALPVPPRPVDLSIDLGDLLGSE